MGLVIHGDGAALMAAGPNGALLMHGMGIGAHRHHRPHEKTRHGQQVAAQVRQGAARLLRVATPGPGGVRIGHEILAEFALETHQLPQLAIADQLPGQDDQWIVLVVVADPGHHPGRLCGLMHLPGLFAGHGQGFFAVHRLAGCQGRHGHGKVQVIGGGDRHQADLGIIDQLAPIRVGLGEPPGLGTLRGALPIGIRQGCQARAHRQFEYRTDTAKSQGVGAPHESGSDQPNAQFIHRRTFGVVVVGMAIYGIKIPLIQY